MVESSLARGAMETVGVLAAFLCGGLGWAELEQRAAAAGGSYPVPAMSEPAPERPHSAGSDDEAAAPGAVWLIDGYNVLCAGVLRGRERAEFWSAPRRRQLLERVARFEARGARVVVVFDGTAPVAEPADPAFAGIETVFAASADAWILDHVRRTAGAPLTVVTADRQLAGRARHRGATILSPLSFLSLCST
jgi:predicted RNA-binding protein with PIN domain